MALKTLNELEDLVKAVPGGSRLGVVAAQDEHTLAAVSAAMKGGLVTPVLYGDEDKIAEIWRQTGDGQALPETVPCTSVEESVRAAVADVRAGELDCLMKGGVETGVLMKEVVNRERGIRKSSLLSIVGLIEAPHYHKLLAITDVGLVMYPDLQQKAELIRNAVGVMRALGTGCPKVAVLAAVEHRNEKMPETVDADLLRQMNREGTIADCVVEGPISIDLSVSAESAQVKDYQSPVAGDADILLVPDFVAGNLLSKGLIFLGGARSCGIVVGAQVPVVLVSRAASAEDKYYSILFAAAAGNGGRRVNHG